MSTQQGFAVLYLSRRAIYLPHGRSGPPAGRRISAGAARAARSARQRYSSSVVGVVQMFSIFSSTLIPTCADKQN